jgi:hypothetical protein
VSTQPSALSERHSPKSPAHHFALAAVVALLILSLWLHLILALEIERMGHDIDLRTEELERLQRENLARMGQITLLESQRRMAEEATALDFRPQQPLYLAVRQPLVRPSDQTGESAFLSLWALGAGMETTAARAAEERPGELPEPAMNVANLP